MSYNVAVAKTEITPPGRVSLYGQFHTRISTHVESPLLANVLVIEKEGEQLILCSCDLCQLGDDFIAMLREKIAKKCPGIDPMKIIFNATHTHTGPQMSEEESGLWVAAHFLPDSIRFDPHDDLPEDVFTPIQNMQYVSDKLCEVISAAWEKKAPGYLAPGFGRAAVGHCRRVTYDDGSARMYGATDQMNFVAEEGTSDSAVELLYIYDHDQKPIGAVVNLACPSQVVEGMYYVSSDFWGKARDAIEAELGSEFVTVAVTAPAGDQSPRDLIRWQSKPAKPGMYPRRADKNNRDQSGSIELGHRIAAEVLYQMEPSKENMISDGVLCCKNIPLHLPVRTVTFAEYREARKNYDAYIAAHPKAVYGSGDMSGLHIDAGIMERFNVQQTQYTYKTDIVVARVGDVAFASSPFELFLDYGNKIRARSYAAQTFLIQLANGSGGYLPTEKAEKGSHYSAYVSSGITGHEGGAQLVRATLENINSMFENE